MDSTQTLLFRAFAFASRRNNSSLRIRKDCIGSDCLRELEVIFQPFPGSDTVIILHDILTTLYTHWKLLYAPGRTLGCGREFVFIQYIKRSTECCSSLRESCP